MKNIFKKTIYFTILPFIACALMGSTKISQANTAQLFDYNEILTPVWSGDIAYQESVLPVEEKDGTINPINLLYKIEEIINVKSASLEKTYKQGIDYNVENGKLIVIKDGSIPRLTYDEYHPADGFYKSKEGGALLVLEPLMVDDKMTYFYHEHQIVITYKHGDKYNGYIPENKIDLLPKFKEKLQNKSDLNLMFYGDSITTGSNASGKWNINVSPYIPIYSDLVKKGIEIKYGNRINLYNYSVGGKDSSWGVETVPTVIDNSPYESYDLIFIAFGMNDDANYTETAIRINKIANLLRKKYENAEIVYLATMLPNPLSINAWLGQEKQGTELMKYEKSGEVVADIGKLHSSLLKQKGFGDMSGNNINHPNDYLTRVYAQALLQTISIDIKTNNGGLIIALVTSGSILVLAGIITAATVKIKKRKNNKGQ